MFSAHCHFKLKQKQKMGIPTRIPLHGRKGVLGVHVPERGTGRKAWTTQDTEGSARELLCSQEAGRVLNRTVPAWPAATLQQPHRTVPAWHHTHQRPPRGSGVLAEATCVSPGFPSRTVSHAHTRHTPAGGSELLALRTTLTLFPAPFCFPISFVFLRCRFCDLFTLRACYGPPRLTLAPG